MCLSNLVTNKPNKQITNKRIFFFVVKSPAADATDAPKPWGLLCNPIMKISFPIFPCSGAPAEWIWQWKTEVLGKNLSECHFVHQKSHIEINVVSD
jgi:hypothetical protein